MKNNTDLLTVTREIQDAVGNITLIQLYNDKTGEPWEDTLYLQFKTEYWDNEEYVIDFLKDLGEKKKELKEVCKEHDLDYKETKVFLKQAYNYYKKYWRKSAKRN